ncbi:MAG TPA: hypothetical protein PKV98_01425 [Burkholderiaceae bacterium]|nr:hypothetical protein [Burkholderiaceae bacterium]
MASLRVSEAAVAQALAAAHTEVQRLWAVSAPDLRALHRGRVEGALDALLTVGLISQSEASELRGAIGVAIEHATS